MFKELKEIMDKKETRKIIDEHHKISIKRWKLYEKPNRNIRTEKYN